MLNFTELLPIGSVVLLAGAQKKLMICGIGQTKEDSGKTYDYIGVLYPEGNMGDGSQFLFNHADIDEVTFRGYEDLERTQFIEKLQEIYINQENKR